MVLMPTTPDRNDGATAVNSPVTAKPANAAMAATTNTRHEPLAGPTSRCTPRRPVRGDVSGTTSTAHRGQHDQHDVHDEGQVERLRRVLDQHPGQ